MNKTKYSVLEILKKNKESGINVNNSNVFITIVISGNILLIPKKYTSNKVLV